MKKLLVLLILTLTSSVPSLKAQSYTITDYAGDGRAGYFGNNIAATSCELYYPSAVAVDSTGTVYIADYDNNRVRRVGTGGVLSIFAGNGDYGYTGDGGLASTAEISRPIAITTDKSGNLYFSDYDNNRIRMVNSTKIISTVAGNGVGGYSGDGGAATAAELNDPIGITVDGSGNLFIADGISNCVRKVNTNGIISTIAGNGIAGYSGDGGPASSSELFDPYAVGADVSGNIYIADNANNCIRKVTTGGIISTVAGNGIAGFYGDGGTATAAELYQPQGVAFDYSGNMYITDHHNQCIRIVTTAGIISTFAGTGAKGYYGDGGPATSAELANPEGAVACDNKGNIFIADESNQRIRKLSIPTGITGLSGENESVNVYPNPNNGKFIIQLSVMSSKWSVEIYNVLAEKVYSQFLIPIAIGNNSHFSIDLRSKPNGVYLFHVLNETGSLISSGKFLIE